MTHKLSFCVWFVVEVFSEKQTSALGFPFSAPLAFFALGALYKWHNTWLQTRSSSLASIQLSHASEWCTKTSRSFLKKGLFEKHNFPPRNWRAWISFTCDMQHTETFCSDQISLSCDQFHTFGAGFFFSTAAGFFSGCCKTRKIF